MIFWNMLNVVVACMSWGKTPSKQSMNRHCDARNRACWIETFLMKEKLFGVLGLKRNIPRKFVLINKAKSAFFLVLFLVLLNPIIHIWYIYLHLNDFHGKCRQIHHTWSGKGSKFLILEKEWEKHHFGKSHISDKPRNSQVVWAEILSRSWVLHMQKETRVCPKF